MSYSTDSYSLQLATAARQATIKPTESMAVARDAICLIRCQSKFASAVHVCSAGIYTRYICVYCISDLHIGRWAGLLRLIAIKTLQLVVVKLLHARSYMY